MSVCDRRDFQAPDVLMPHNYPKVAEGVTRLV
jgi:hypothetical protein